MGFGLLGCCLRLGLKGLVVRLVLWRVESGLGAWMSMLRVGVREGWMVLVALHLEAKVERTLRRREDLVLVSAGVKLRLSVIATLSTGGRRSYILRKYSVDDPVPCGDLVSPC